MTNPHDKFNDMGKNHAMNNSQKLGLPIAACFLVVAFGMYANWRPFRMLRPNAAIKSARASIARVFRHNLLTQHDDPMEIELRNLQASMNSAAKNPNAIVQDAALFETFVNARSVAREAIQSSDKLPYLSTELDRVHSQNAEDHWGKPFCVAGNKSILLVVSAGDSGRQLSCRKNPAVGLLTGIPRNRMMKTDAGFLVLVADRSNELQ